MLSLLLSFLACTPEPELLTGLKNPTGGDPLVGEVALYPFPSDYFLEDDASTATGHRVAWPETGMPGDFTPGSFAHMDGFSRITPILAWLEGGFSSEGLPGADDVADSVAEDAPIWLVSADGERIPYLAEPDSRAEDAEHQSLIVRPLQALDPATRYVVMIFDDVKRADGSEHVAHENFVALRDGLLSDNADIEAWRDDFELVNQHIAETGRDPSEVLLAWSFTTRSSAQVVDPILKMQQVAGSWELEPWQLVEEEDDGSNRILTGTFEAPDFLGEDGVITLDDSDEPVVHGTREVRFFFTVPATVTEPRPAMVYGHGFFWGKEEATVGTLNADLQTWRISAATTDFIGFNEGDLGPTLSTLVTDIDNAYTITSQQLQSHVHMTLLGRLIEEQLVDDVLDEAGEPLVDASNIPYMGISNGGTQGLTLMTTSPFFTRGALIVGGGGWSHFIERAVQWNTLGSVLAEDYGSQLDIQLLLAMIQHKLDGVDGMNFVDHLLTDRLDGVPATVEVTLHEAVGDCQVPNFTTEAIARSAGMPLVSPSPRDVWGLDTVSAEDPGYDGDAALLIYDMGAEPPPEGNLSPSEDNGAHEDIRRQASYDEQVGAFLEDGTIIQVCEGACDPD